jgi:hypothetical protein
VRNILTARYDVARGSQERATFTAQAATTQTASAPVATTLKSATSSATGAAPDTAGIANAFAAAVPTPTKADDKQQIFHGLFVDGGRAAPLAPVVSALWGVPNTAPSGGATTAQKPVANGMLDLFRDPPTTGS